MIVVCLLLHPVSTPPCRIAETGRSMCSLIVLHVSGLADSLITGKVGLPMIFLWPVGTGVPLHRTLPKA